MKTSKNVEENEMIQETEQLKKKKGKRKNELYSNKYLKASWSQSRTNF